MAGRRKEVVRERTREWMKAHPDYHQKFYQEHREQLMANSRKWRLEHPKNVRAYSLKRKAENFARKARVLAHYGNGRLACVRCGESRLACLSIDHIEGGGTKARKETGLHGNLIYIWLERNDFPKGYQTLCMNCQFVKAIENNEQN